MRMNRRLVFFSLLVFATAAFAAESISVLFKGPLPLKAEQAPLLFKQCSRFAPNPEGPLWFPSAAEVEALEARLEKHIAAMAVKPPAFRAGRQYRGQYVGFMRGNVKHIYASYVPASTRHADLSGNAILVCDGGYRFWGIVYNTATGQFSELAFNGDA